MKLAQSAFAVFFSTMTFGSVGSVWCQESLIEPQTLKESSPFFVSAEPYSVSVTWLPDGTLSVNPDLVSLVGDVSFKQMQLPPSIRTTSENGWLVGEFELQDGSWSLLFSMPDGESDSDLPVSGDTVVFDTKISSSTATGTTISDTASSEISDPLAIGTSDPAFPVTITLANLKALIGNTLKPGCHRFFVNNVSGDDSAEGVMIHPQIGKLLKKGPFRTLTAAREKIKTGDEVIIVGTGKAYQWADLNGNSTDMIITPVGDITLEP